MSLVLKQLQAKLGIKRFHSPLEQLQGRFGARVPGKIRAFSPTEARDERGRWAPGTGMTLPEAPGSQPIPEGHVRLYHQTREENLDTIAKEGIRFDKAKGIEGPRAIYADERGFYGKPGKTPTVEFSMPAAEWAKTAPFVNRDVVKPEEIIAIHKPWHQHARYILNDAHGVFQKVQAGEFDNLLKPAGNPEGKAVAYIKSLPADAQEKYQAKHPITRGTLKAGGPGSGPRPTDSVLVKFGSHRSRDKSFRILENKPFQGYSSFKRDTGRGVYEMTEAHLAKIAHIKGVSRFKPGSDLIRNWSAAFNPDEQRDKDGKWTKVTIRASSLRAGGPGSGRKPTGAYAWIDHPHLGVLTKPYTRSAGGAHDEIARAHDFGKDEFPRGHVEIDNKQKQYHITNYNGDNRPEPGLSGRLRSALKIPRDYLVPRPKTAGPFSPGVYAGGPGSGPHPAQHLGYSAFKKLGNPDSSNWGERRGHLDFSPGALRKAMRENKGMKHWVAFSLGSSFHDPQGMYHVLSGPKVPDGVQEITNALQYRAAWKHIKETEVEAFKRSRRMDYSAAFNPDEARDKDGKWTNGPGGGDNATPAGSKEYDKGNGQKTTGDKTAVPGSKPGGNGGGRTVPATTRPVANTEVQGIADAFNKTWNGPQIDHARYDEVDQSKARDIANAYDSLQKFNKSPEVLSAYKALGKEIQQQWDFATKQGIKFEPWKKEGQPYQTSQEMAKDVADNKHLYFYTGGEKHPLLGQVDPKTGLTRNDQFRAVHDLFGHAAGGFGFGARGEEAAFQAHSQMFSKEAQKAMATETRGQNSWVNFGKQNYDADGKYKNLPATSRPFAEQKVDLLPADLRKAQPQATGNIFVSPNTDKLTFDQAQQNLSSPRQAEMRKSAAAIVREFTPTAKIADVIGDWHDGAENSLLIHANIKDPEALKYAAARMGLEAGQTAVIPFSVSAAGKDALWSIRVNHSDLGAIRDTLSKTGLQFRTLEAQGKETLVHVFDPGTMLKGKIQTAARQLGGRITVAKGTGQFLGSDESREEGAKEYRKVIQEYERKKLPLAAAGRIARTGHDFYANQVRRNGSHLARAETSGASKKVRAEALTGLQVDYYNRGITMHPATNDHPPSLKNPILVHDPKAQDGWKRGASKKARRKAMEDLVRLLKLGMNQPGIPTQGGRTASVPVFPLVDRLT